MSARAKPLSPQERRSALIEVTVPLLLEHGRAVTTKQIAEAGGVAEGTIFRVFESKDDLVSAALDRAFDSAPFLADLRRIEPDQPLRHLVGDIVTMLQIRFRGIFELMTAMGIVGPPQLGSKKEQTREEAATIMADLLTPHAAQLRVPVDDVVHMIRLLSFSGTHPRITNGRTLSAAEITSTLLDGLLAKEH